jgi:AcrR family transcriptional regulator
MIHPATSEQRHSPLNRELILDGAIELIEGEGADALSMRRLGGALGVEAMAIYHHFAGREDLLAGLADRLLAPLGMLELGTEWREACRRFAHGLRQIAITRPATFRLVALQPLEGRSLVPVERLLEVLLEGGFDPGSALAVYRATASYARGYALAEVTGFTVDAAGPDGYERLRALSLAEFPILAGRSEELVELDADRAFSCGLQALLRGLRTPPGSVSDEL